MGSFNILMNCFSDCECCWACCRSRFSVSVFAVFSDFMYLLPFCLRMWSSCVAGLLMFSGLFIPSPARIHASMAFLTRIVYVSGCWMFLAMVLSFFVDFVFGLLVLVF